MKTKNCFSELLHRVHASRRDDVGIDVFSSSAMGNDEVKRLKSESLPGYSSVVLVIS